MINKKQETRNKKLEIGKFLSCLRFSLCGLKLKSGYTLIEFLIVIGILSVSIGSILLLLTSVIKGSNQANIIAEVKQNGECFHAKPDSTRQFPGYEMPGALKFAFHK